MPLCPEPAKKSKQSGRKREAMELQESSCVSLVSTECIEDQRGIITPPHTHTHTLDDET